MTTMYLIRHCETVGNQKKVFQGSIDMDVSPAGAAQLELLAERFARMPLDEIRSSPLLRALRTAEAVNRHHSLPIRTDPRLAEINAGFWEGKPWADLPRLDPEQCRLWLREPWRFQPRDAEPMTSVYRRMSEALLEIAADCDGRTVAVISHGCAIRNALCFARGWPIRRLAEVPWCDNTSICTFEITDGRIRILSENDHDHLPPAAASPAEQNSWWRG